MTLLPHHYHIIKIGVFGASFRHVRLYYKPDDTPKGRDPLHGADEVLASRRNPTMPYATFISLISTSANDKVAVVTFRE